jgi:hypothetical protein
MTDANVAEMHQEPPTQSAVNRMNAAALVAIHAQLSTLIRDQRLCGYFTTRNCHNHFFAFAACRRAMQEHPSVSLRLMIALLVLVASVPAFAQSSAPPSAPPVGGYPTTPGEPVITPRNGQNTHQLWSDRYECYGWAKTQSGFDPVQPNGKPNGRDLYRRAFTACMDGRGYNVSYAAAPPQPVAPPPPPPPPPPPRVAVMRAYTPILPDLVYRPLNFQIEGGYTVAAGTTNDYFDDGGNVGVGLGWFPSASLPVGVRFDGSYTRFDARNAFLAGGDFSHGHEELYGGDLDLQLNLAHRASNFQFYLLGGAGLYREHTYLEGFAPVPGPGCGSFGCAVRTEQWSTSPWRSSWNAGVGGEVALPGGSSFFVEARYQRIAPHDSDMQFVPIRVGIRF